AGRVARVIRRRIRQVCEGCQTVTTTAASSAAGPVESSAEAGGTGAGPDPRDASRANAGRPPADPGAKLSGADVTHSDDFRSARWYGTEYVFSPTQAACVRVLWEAWERGSPVVGQETVLDGAGSVGNRLRDVFEKGKHPAWGVMIVSPRKGAFRLA